MNPRNFFAELQRRHVYKVGAAYAVGGWLLVQIVTQVFPIFDVSALAQRIIVLLIVAGFPITLILTWLFDITSQGIVRTGELPATGEAPGVRRERRGADRKLNYILGALLLAAVVYFAAERFGLIKGFRETALTAAAVNAKSIAVLPLLNESGDPKDEYFSDGLSEELIAALASDQRTQSHRPQLFVSFQRQKRRKQNNRREAGREHAAGRHGAQAREQGAHRCRID